LGEEWIFFNKAKEKCKYQTEVIKLKNTITELKNILEGFKSRPDEAEELISDLKDRAVELTQTEQQKEEFDTRQNSICDIGIVEGGERKRGIK